MGDGQMHVHGTLASVPRALGLDWSTESLDQGSRVSRRVLSRLDREALHAYAIVPEGRVSLEASPFSQSARLGDADSVLPRIFRGLPAVSDGILIVDDDLSRRGDPGLDGVSFVDDRVIRWEGLQSPSQDLTRLIRRGASGYPLNAFISGNRQGQTLRPSVGSLSDSDVLLLASEVQVVIHSIYDAESFLLLVLDEEVNAFLGSLI